RVDERVDDIDYQTDHHDYHREHGDDALHRGVITQLDVIDELVADPGPIERLLGQDRAGEQEGDLQADDRHDGYQCITKGVRTCDAAFADAAGTRRFNVVPRQRLQHINSHQANENTAEQQTQRERRQNQMDQHVADGFAVTGYDRVQ